MLDLPSPALIGVIHLAPLPGSPRHTLPPGEILGRAVADAKALERAGFDACIVENFGDAPFLRNCVSPAAVAMMAIVADRVHSETALRVGINVLRNDTRSALGIAAATEATFVRSNVHIGVAATDQGLLEGDAAESLRFRKELGRRIAILADVHVKHATPVSEPDIARAARDTAYRGLADGLIVTGPATGEVVDPNDLQRVCDAVPDRRVFVGSGVTPDTVHSLLRLASGVIVGSGIKVNHDPAEPIDLSLAERFVVAARGAPAP